MRILRLALVLTTVAGLFVPPAASAAVGASVTFVVNTARDVDNPTDGKCSLREAVIGAHGTTADPPLVPGECPIGSSELDTIKLKRDTTYKLTLDGDIDEDDNVDGDLDVLFGSVKIVGGRGTTIEQRDKDQRVIDILGGTVILERVTITGGRAQVGPLTDGGGIRNDGTLTLRRSAVVGNRAGAGDVDTATSGGLGGGIYNTGTLTVERSKIANNAAGDGADSIGDDPEPTGAGNGGGIYNKGTLSVLSSKVVKNRAGDGGTGRDAGGPNASYAGSFGGTGGAIVNQGLASIERSTVSGNRAGDGGSGGDGGETTGVTSDQPSEGGGGGYAGGIYADTGSSTIVLDSTISANRAGYGGEGGQGLPGSGLFGEPGDDGLGGGLMNNGVASLRNATFSGNQARYGGGVFAYGDMLANNVTFARNTASFFGGGLYASGDFLQLSNSLLADNEASAGKECAGTTIIANRYNFVEDPADCNGISGTDVTGGDPRLGPLDANGGPTKTHALKSGSLAIDAGNPATPDGSIPNCESNDQRGKPRSVCDIGAYER